ncbi:MAG: hypothetical protein AAF936_10565 [Pseudomonadota bacterium]
MFLVAAITGLVSSISLLIVGLFAPHRFGLPNPEARWTPARFLAILTAAFWLICYIAPAISIMNMDRDSIYSAFPGRGLTIASYSMLLACILTAVLFALIVIRSGFGRNRTVLLLTILLAMQATILWEWNVHGAAF